MNEERHKLQGIIEIKEKYSRILKDFNALLNGHTITYTSLPAGYLQPKQVEISFDDSDQPVPPPTQPKTNNLPEATLSIKGAMVKEVILSKEPDEKTVPSS